MSECLVFSLRKKTLRENTRPYRYHGLKIFTSLRLRFQDFQRPIKLLPLDGIVASVENVRQRRFPLSRPLNLITREEPTGIAKTFIDYASSAQVNDLIEAQYFVPVAN